MRKSPPIFTCLAFNVARPCDPCIILNIGWVIQSVNRGNICFMNKITNVEVLTGFQLDLAFADGTRGVVDLSDLAGHGVFALWNDYAEFRKVRIGDTGELVWSDKIDLCPDSLYLKVSGKRPEDLFPALQHETVHA